MPKHKTKKQSAHQKRFGKAAKAAAQVCRRTAKGKGRKVWSKCMGAEVRERLQKGKA